jgi:hypothetical protein
MPNMNNLGRDLAIAALLILAIGVGVGLFIAWLA